ncbi:GntR family transcriptional regulator [Ferrovibrio sp.]|uniref:GntR family transcriptional regulator n=1 Tax=Ferrovibrio sp. TaxID=1917215 RepID=UPI0035B2EFAD
MGGESSANASSITSAEAAARAIRELILEGSIPAGSRLGQDELAERLGVSRTPLRTALAELSREGLVQYSSHRGYWVRGFNSADISNAFEVRASLEALACELAARNGMSAETIGWLEERLADGDRILSSGRLKPELLAPYRRMNVDFHSTIIEAAQNPWVADFVKRSHNVPMASDRIIVWGERDFSVIHRSHDDHHRILNAIAARDGDRAAALMREHVRYAGEVLLKHLEGSNGQAGHNSNGLISHGQLTQQET